MKRGLALNYIEASGFSLAACSPIPYACILKLSGAHHLLEFERMKVFQDLVFRGEPGNLVRFIPEIERLLDSGWSRLIER